MYVYVYEGTEQLNRSVARKEKGFSRDGLVRTVCEYVHSGCWASLTHSRPYRLRRSCGRLQNRSLQYAREARPFAMDYYKVLGVRRGASNDDINAAYRYLSMEWNPVKRAGDEAASQMFLRITEAFDVLITPRWRAVYEIQGERGLKAQEYRLSRTPEEIFAKFYGTNNPFAQVTFNSFTDQATEQAKDPLTTRTAERLIPLDLTLEEIYCGTTKLVEVERSMLGGEQRKEMVSVDVKPGLAQGDTFLFKTKGDHDAGKEPGDLRFQVNELPHGSFTRSGDNLHYTANVTLAEALGEYVLSLTALDGHGITVEYGEVIMPDTVRVVKGEGMPVAGTKSFGDLVISFNISFPQHLTLDQKNIISNVLTGNPTKAFRGKK